MRAALLFSAAFAAGVFACPKAASADVPSYGELPSGHATAPPETTPPSSIPAHEKVPGFFVATPRFGRRFKGSSRGMPPAPSYVLVVASAEQAKRIEAGELGSERGEQDGACLSQVHRFARPTSKPGDEDEDFDDDPTKPPFPDWREGMSDAAAVNLKTESSSMGGVTAVHSERFVSDAAGPRVEMVDVWVDPATKGVRKIASATLPLKLVGTSRGLAVHAARDDRDKVKAVQFVVVRPKDMPDRHLEALVAVTANGANMTSSSCSHLRFALNAGDGSADSALLKTSLRLPDRPEATDGERRIRLREAALQIGVSKTKRDKAPVLSLTFGWSGRETSQLAASEE